MIASLKIVRKARGGYVCWHVLAGRDRLIHITTTYPEARDYVRRLASSPTEVPQ